MYEQEMNQLSEKMDKSITALKNEFTTIRTGQANASLLDRVFVEYYGSRTPVTQVASVTVPEARLLVVQPWDTVSRFEQQTLARFIREGYFTRHLARERVAYKARRDALAASLRAAFAPDKLTLTGLHTGLHLLARLKNAPPDAALRAAAKAQGVALSLLSDYDLTGGEQEFSGTFVLGYGSLSEASFPEAGETLRKVCTAAREASVTV